MDLGGVTQKEVTPPKSIPHQPSKLIKGFFNKSSHPLNVYPFYFLSLHECFFHSNKIIYNFKYL